MDQQEIISEIKALSSHYPKRARSPQDEFRWLMDWGNDLAGYSPADVRMVCALWRVSNQKHMPTPGDLIAKCRQLEKPNLDRIPGTAADPEAREPVSPAERAKVKAMMTDFLADMGRKPKVTLAGLAKKAGETDVDHARRLWPKHERPRP